LALLTSIWGNVCHFFFQFSVYLFIFNDVENMLCRMMGSAVSDEEDMEGSGCRIIKVLSQYLPGGTEENRSKPQSGRLASSPRLQPSTSTLQDRTVTAEASFLIMFSSVKCKFVRVF
jgi:hypothetical protein